MMPAMDGWIDSLVAALALPQYGLATVFLASLISATLLPMASVPFVYGIVQVNPAMFWPALLVATAGNTLGGVITYWMGAGAEKAYEKVTDQGPARPHDARALRWLQRWGPPACLLAWLPVVGDPLCAVAGWLRLPFWPCTAYMALGKFLRYLFYVGGLAWLFPWHGG
jgi:membrane protein YqaA with SNARE-associated domain